MMNNESIKKLAELLHERTNNIHFIEGTIKTLRTDTEKEQMVLFLTENKEASMKDISYQTALIIGPRLGMK